MDFKLDRWLATGTSKFAIVWITNAKDIVNYILVKEEHIGFCRWPLPLSHCIAQYQRQRGAKKAAELWQLKCEIHLRPTKIYNVALLWTVFDFE